jgi:hypothetical protein
MREAGHQALPNRIVEHAEHDRDGAGCLLQFNNYWRATGDDDIWRRFHRLRRVSVHSGLRKALAGGAATGSMPELMQQVFGVEGVAKRQRLLSPDQYEIGIGIPAHATTRRAWGCDGKAGRDEAGREGERTR